MCGPVRRMTEGSHTGNHIFSMHQMIQTHCSLAKKTPVWHQNFNYPLDYQVFSCGKTLNTTCR